jgi:F0F1-type ATP synthase assembly protein I
MPEEDPFKKVRDDLEKMGLPEEGESDEIESRFQELQEKHQAEMPTLPDPSELDQRFERLQQQVGSVRERQETERQETARRRRLESSDAKSMGLGLSAAYAIIGMPLLGAGVGWLVDSAMGTVIWKGMLCLLGAIVGIWFAISAASRKH